MPGHAALLARLSRRFGCGGLGFWCGVRRHISIIRILGAHLIWAHVRVLLFGRVFAVFVGLPELCGLLCLTHPVLNQHQGSKEGLPGDESACPTR